VPGFLTEEWIAAVNAALDSAPVPSDASVAVGHLVRGEDGAAAGYVLRVAGGRVAASLGDETTVDGADVVLIHDVATALAIHRGELTPLQAVEAGRLKIRGSPQALIAHAGTIAALRERVASVATEG
jgi:hypothetical protein